MGRGRTKGKTYFPVAAFGEVKTVTGINNYRRIVYFVSIDSYFIAASDDQMNSIV